MPELKPARTSLEVGFPEGELPENFVRFRGKDWRKLGPVKELPYDDAQFELVMLDKSVICASVIREVHRVLKPGGVMRFTVPERTKKQAGLSLPEIYSIVRDGFNLIEVERPSWWLFGCRGRTITICAQKKAWKVLRNQFRPYV